MPNGEAIPVCEATPPGDVTRGAPCLTAGCGCILGAGGEVILGGEVTPGLKVVANMLGEVGDLVLVGEVTD